MVDYIKTPARTIELRRIKKFIDTSELDFVTNYSLRQALGFHKHKIDDALNFLIDMGLIGVVTDRNQIKRYFSKIKSNPSGIKAKKSGKRDNKAYEEETTIIKNIEVSGEVSSSILKDKSPILVSGDTYEDLIKVDGESLLGLEEEK